MTVVIAGEVDPGRARDLVAKYFGAIPNPGVTPTHPFTEPPQRGARRAVVKKVSQVEALLAGYHAVGSRPSRPLSPEPALRHPLRRQGLPLLPGVHPARQGRGPGGGDGPPALLGPGPGPTGGGPVAAPGQTPDGVGKRAVDRPGTLATRRGAAPRTGPGQEIAALSGGEQPVPATSSGVCWPGSFT